MYIILVCQDAEVQLCFLVIAVYDVTIVDLLNISCLGSSKMLHRYHAITLARVFNAWTSFICGAILFFFCVILVCDCVLCIVS